MSDEGTIYEGQRARAAALADARDALGLGAHEKGTEAVPVTEVTSAPAAATAAAAETPSDARDAPPDAHTEPDRSRDGELLGIAPEVAERVALTDEERATLAHLADGIARAEEQQRRARTKAASLKRQLKATRDSVLASRVSELLGAGR